MRRSGEWWFGLAVVVIVLAGIAWGAYDIPINLRYEHELRDRKVEVCKIIQDPGALTLCLKEVGA